MASEASESEEKTASLSPAGAESHTYRCDRGHELKVEGGTYTTFLATFTSADGKVTTGEYNFCPFCFGAWAVGRFPLREIAGEAADQG